MKISLWLTATIFFLTLTIRVFASNDSYFKPIIIKGILWNNAERNQLPTVVLVKNFAMPLSARNFNTESYVAQVVEDSFFITIPVNTKFVYLQLLNFGKTVRNPGQLFLFRSGDSLSFFYKENQLPKITGKNVESFLFQVDLDKAVTNSDIEYPSPYADTYLADFGKRVQQLLLEQEKVFKKYKSTLDPQVFRIIRLNSICRTRIRQASSYYLKLIYDSLPYLKKALPYIRDLHNDRIDTDSQLWVYSSDYLYYLHFKEWIFFRAKDIIENGVNKDYSKTFEKTFAYLKENYSGQLRDRLITFHFKRNSKDAGQSFSLINDALSFVKDDDSRKRLLEVKTQLPGIKAYQFDFTDLAGKRYNLDDFRGKTVIFHFWFLGCHGCLDLKKEMESIIPTIQARPNILLVSVNVDTEKQRWITGLEQKKYTSDIDLNLYTDGFGINHPFLKHYQYSAFPQMFIIDKDGYIISANPPRPDGEENVKEFLNLLGVKPS